MGEPNVGRAAFSAELDAESGSTDAAQPWTLYKIVLQFRDLWARGDDASFYFKNTVAINAYEV